MCRECNGSKNIIARVLNQNPKTVMERIDRIPELRALYGSRGELEDPVKPPTEVETMVRSPADIPADVQVDNGRAEMLMQQDRELLRSGLAAAGIRPETIQKIKALDGLARNAGSFLSVSLDYTHRLHIFSTAALFEELVYIRENYLRPGEDGKPRHDPMVMVFWQRAFNEIAEMLGKSYDRTLTGTQAMISIMKTRGATPGVRGAQTKPGWGGTGTP